MAPASDRSHHLPTGLVAGLVFLVVLAALLVLIRDRGAVPDPGPDDVRVEAFERRIAERLDPVTIRPVAGLRIRAANVVWRDARGQPWLEAPSVTFAVDVGALRGGAILVRDGQVLRPVLRLTQSPAGVWNYESVLDPLLNGGDRRGTPRAAATPISLRNIVVRDGEVTVVRPDQRVAARSLDATLTFADLAGPQVRDPLFVFARAEAVLDLPGLEEGQRVTRAAVVEDATLRLVNGAVAFDVRTGEFGASRFADAVGVWDPALGGLGLDAVLTAGPVRLADLPWLRTDLPDDAVGSSRLRIQPLAGDRTVLSFSELSVTGGGSTASGALALVVGGTPAIALESADLRLDPLDLALIEAFTGPLPYSGTVAGRVVGSGGALEFELQARLGSAPFGESFVTDLTGQVAFTPTGVDVQRVTAQLDRLPLSALQQILPGLPLSGPVSGTVTLRGAPGEAPISLDVRLEAGGGIISLAGTVDLRGPVPAYDLQGRLAGVEVRRLLAPPVPPVQVHAGFRLSGSGTELATANATVQADGTFTGWESGPGDTLSVLLSVASGAVTADRFRVTIGPIQAIAEGSWQFVGPGGGSIRYTLAVQSLEPLGPYLPADRAGRRQFARGSLRARGALAGTLDRPVLSGSVSGDDFRYGVWAAAEFAGEYEYVSTAGLPTIEAEFAGTDLRTPSGDFDTARLMLDFTRPTFELSIAADQVGGGLLELEAGGRIEETTGEREVQLRRMEIDLRGQRWRLPSPALIAWTQGDAVQVDDLRLEQVAGGGLLRVDGIVAPADRARFVVEMRSVPIGDVLALADLDLDLRGELTADARFVGSPDTPTFDANLVLLNGTFRDIDVRHLQLELDYTGTDLAIAGRGQLGDTAVVEIEGRVPMIVDPGLVPGFELVADAPLQIALVTREFPLATLDPGIPTVRDMVGRVNADVRISGTPDAPVLSGTAAIREGAVRVPMLDQRYHEISATATFEGRQMVLQQLTAVSGGTATATGTLTFEDLTNPTLDLRAELDGFRPQGVSNVRDAAAWGTVRLSGTVREPHLTGSTRLDDGTISITAFQGPTFEEQFNRPPEFELVRAQDTGLGDEPIGGLTVGNLSVTAGSDLWFATDEARVQLSGNLIVNRQAGDLSIQGQLAGDRGTFNLRIGPVTRRFEIVEANIRFFGTPEPNPGLDIVASRLIRTARSGDVEVRARVTGTLSNPSLSLATGEGATVPESEILSFLLFGRSEATLGTVAGDGGLLALDELAAFAGGFDLLSERIMRATDFGLDYFQLQLRPGGGLQGSNLFVIVGHEVVDDFFVSWETPLDPTNSLWALTGEWRIDRQWTVEAGLEPRHYRAGTTIPVPFNFGDRDERQVFIGIRRRWTY